MSGTTTQADKAPAATETSPRFAMSWIGARKALRDAAMVGLTCAGLALLKTIEETDPTKLAGAWQWTWQAALATGSFSAVRRFLTDYSNFR